ncbi:hypothetical protein H920_17703 [Fukomys damarensis]|uniref:Uncharacterized protein n=1 Tax=Fukomys damarensis TaxID=885580 RepID=A0A091CTL9_FUKDA|nr:hypothetical protein H920_17703 [Fukomys damarensis]
MPKVKALQCALALEIRSSTSVLCHLKVVNAFPLRRRRGLPPSSALLAAAQLLVLVLSSYFQAIAEFLSRLPTFLPKLQLASSRGNPLRSLFDPQCNPAGSEL